MPDAQQPAPQRVDWPNVIARACIVAFTVAGAVVYGGWRAGVMATFAAGAGSMLREALPRG